MFNNKRRIIIIGLIVVLSILIYGCSYKLINSRMFDKDGTQKLCEEKKYDEALKMTDEYLKSYPNDKTALAEKSYILIKSGKNEDGLVILTKLYEKYSHDDSILNNISWAYNNLHLYKMANIYIDKAMAISPNSDKEYVNKGNALEGLKKYDEAMEYYDRALIKNSKSSYALWGEGLCLFYKKEYKRCIDYFKKYRELCPDDKSTNYYITNSFLKLKDYDGAINEYKSQIKSNPKNYSAYISLGNVYKQMKDYKNALECYENVIKKSKDYADAYYEKAICLVKLGKNDEACENLKLAINSDPEYIYDIEDEEEFAPLHSNAKYKALFN